MEDSSFDIRSFPKCDNLFELGEEIGRGVSGRVYHVVEKRSGRSLAAKIVPVTAENEAFLTEECRIWTKLPKNENIVDLYDIYMKKEGAHEEIWIVTELCIGSAADFVQRVLRNGTKMQESHIAYILKGLIKAVIHLHENRVIHRDVRGANVLFTKDGEVRLTDFGISKMVESKSGKLRQRIGSQAWMAPEAIRTDAEYGNQVDVWALGITALELAEGKAPYEDMHPARALFQILKNPPPSLLQPSSWSQLLVDFVSECLEKNPENRPDVREFLDHPLFADSDSDTNVQTDIIATLTDGSNAGPKEMKPEILVKGDFMKVGVEPEEKILRDDLTSMEDVSEEAVMLELEERLKKKNFYTFAGDVLLALNPNQELSIFGTQYHELYRFKSRSDRVPHVYAVADSAYQAVLHHQESQQILLTGESMSGKTTNMLHILDHLLYLGQGNKCGINVEKAVNIIHALGNAGTLSNPNSTRHILQTQVSFTPTGKTSGAIFWIYQLEKNRVTSSDTNTRNFHIFYYFHDALKSENNLAKYYLGNEREYQYLRNDGRDLKGPGRVPKENAVQFLRFEENLKDLGLDEGQLKMIRRVLAAILILGEIEFETDDEGHAKVKTQKEADAVADLLGLDQKKFSWALIKYCVIMKGEASMRYHTEEEAIESKNVLARGMYFRLVDWIVNIINEKLSIARAIFGDKYTINLLDLYGFECSTTNSIDQLLINSMNEQLQYFYNQKVFAWEMKDSEEEEIEIPILHYNDNKLVMDQILSKPDGLMHLIDEDTKTGGVNSLSDNLKNLNKSSHISLVSENEFSIAHYTGKITYKISEILNKNRDFLPPEMIETMRRSTHETTRALFTGLLTTTGNLTMHSDLEKMDNREGRWNTAFKSTNKKFRGRKFNTSSKGQYSQSRQMRTATTTFRATCLEILRSLTANESSVHFVRCIRTSLSNTPNEFQKDLIRQQIKAFGVVETVKARQSGYSYRVTFSDFIKRYRFLAFEFNENVEETKENCRLLLVRLKMDGWKMGKTKVFLRYCDQEYLSRMYGNNVRKIVKVQSMMRAFLARRNLRAKIKRFQEGNAKEGGTPEPLDSCPKQDLEMKPQEADFSESETEIDDKKD